MAAASGWPFRFRPQLWPTVAAGGAFLVLIGLGTWQLDRLQWKTALIAEREAQLAAPAIPLAATAADPAQLAFRRVSVSGTFDHAREMYVAAVSQRGNAGSHVVTPLLRADGAGWVLVNRGWVPPERKDPARRAAGQVPGPVTVTGVARLPQRPAGMVPDHQPDRNLWFTMDVPVMAAAAGLAPVAPVWVEADGEANPGGFPIGGQTRISLPNDHLQYAITWYSLAIALVFVWLFFHRPADVPPAPPSPPPGSRPDDPARGNG